MRRFMMNFCFLLFALPMLALPLSGISIQSNRGPVLVFIDNQQVCTPTESCFIANLRSGSYRVEVYAVQQQRDMRSKGNVRKGKLLYGEWISYNGRGIEEIFVGEDRMNHPDRFSYQDRVMSPESFQNFMRILKNQAFDSDRTKTVEASLPASYFTSEQCKKIADIYKFDDGKVEFMQAVYPKVVDKQNFFMIVESLTFQSSKDKMNEFMRNY